MRKFYIKTFGCKVNQYESQLIREALSLEGWIEVDSIREADVLIINGCAVTRRAEKKAKELVFKWVADKEIVLTGCAATALKDKLPRDKKDKIILVAQDEKNNLPKYLGLGIQVLPSQITGFSGHTRAFVKLQDGCSMSCSYCYIPHLRGPARLRNRDEIKSELEALARAGYKEIVFTGICLGWGRQDIASLARFAVKQLKIARIRLSSIEPFFVGEDILSLLSEGIICEHLHIPFQSGSKTVLFRMRRPYSPEKYLDIVERARKACPDVAISTDIMVGFPGETEREFEETLVFLQELKPMRIHVFPYSPRPGTLAVRMKGQVPEKVKKQRLHRIMGLANNLAKEYINKFLGRSLEVLFEEKTGNFWVGRSRNYLEVKVSSNDSLHNQIKKVVLESSDLYGKITD